MAGRVRGLLERLLVRQRAEQHSGVPDAELLRHFTRDRDEAAFELLVWRHGAMVLGLCRRAVRDEQLAEDAFQAVFLVLARKSGAIRGNLGGWLFKVARRVSARAAARRPVTLPVIETSTEHPDSAERDELSALLDAEIARLPERLRRPVVLCYLGGQSTEDAARELGCPRGTVLSRLAAARKRLADRLTRRGCALPATLTGTALSGRLVSEATAAATAFRSGLLTASTATFLANGVLGTMNRVTFLTAFGGIALAASLVGGVGWIATDRGPNVAFAAADAPADPPKPIPAPPKAVKPDPDAQQQLERRQLEDRRKKLEQLAESMRIEIEALEKNIELLVKVNATDATRTALLQQQLAELEAEIRATERELTKLEAEVTVLKKVAADKATPVDPVIVQDMVAKDPLVIAHTVATKRAEQDYALAAQVVPVDEPKLRRLKDERDVAEKRLNELKAKITEEITTLAKARAAEATNQRISDLETNIKVKRLVLDKLKLQRDALVKAVTVAVSAGADIERMRAALTPQYEALTRVQREIFILRAQRDGITFTEASGTDAKLDAILKELAALRKDVQELKAKK